MKTKKIILFIVEGPSDKESLGLILSKLVKNENVKFQIVYGDITSDKNTEVSNALTKVNGQIKKFLGYTYKKSDILKVIHLVDTDGAYIDESLIEEADVDSFVYSEDCIKAKSIDQVKRRNDKKSKVINRLYNCGNISSIDYKMYFFSCNLEHVLHDEINANDAMKRQLAEDFADKFYGNETSFVDFINEYEIAVEGDYCVSWEYIKNENNSLKRNSNFHLFFSD